MVKKYLIKAPFIIAASLLLAGIYLLGWSNILTVKSLRIDGAPSPAVSKVLEVKSDIKLGENLARINPRLTSRKLAEISWIQEARISRNWLEGSVTIEIIPREPIAFFNSQIKQGQTIDEQGNLFTLPGYSNPELARISATSPESAFAANELFTSLPQDFRGSISSMSATSVQTFTLIKSFKKESIRIQWGDATQSGLKVRVVEKILTLPENRKILEIDVAAPHAPIVK